MRFYRITMILGLMVLIGLAGCIKPTLKTFGEPEKTAWRPEGPRPPASDNQALSAPTTYSRTFHADTHNADEVSIAAPPMFELQWVAEKGMFIVEGPTLDRAGNVYFTPTYTKESVVLVSLSSEDGSRRWDIQGDSNDGGGAPLVLNDPQNSGKQIIYVGGYDRAFAVRQDGSFVWDVETGLPEPNPKEAGSGNHCFGLNYHTPTDSIIGVTGDGHVYVLDRLTGRTRLANPYLIPGEKTPPAKILGIPLVGRGGLITLLQAILGGRVKMANYFAIDAHSGRLWVAATSPDEEDGKVDGLSEYGALYALELSEQNGSYQISEVFHVPFEGGTGSTPSLKADGSRVYVGDSFGNLLAIDATNGDIIWKVDIDEQIVASISVAADNGELYAPTVKYLVKVIDRGDYGELAWRSKLDMYKALPGLRGINLMGGAVVANGVIIHAGVGPGILPFKVGVGLLDRKTGEIRYFTEGREESVAAPIVGSDGSIYIGHSPIRHLIAWIMFPLATEPITTGVAKYGAIRNDLLVRDCVCAASDRADNASRIAAEHPASAETDVRQIKTLINQALDASEMACSSGEMSRERADLIKNNLVQAGESLTIDNLDSATEVLSQMCVITSKGDN